jgi:hypothetical protein
MLRTLMSLAQAATELYIQQYSVILRKCWFFVLTSWSFSVRLFLLAGNGNQHLEN